MDFKKSKGFASEEQYDAVIEALESYTDRQLVILKDCFDSIYIDRKEEGLKISFKLNWSMDFLELTEDGPILTMAKRYGCNTACLSGMALEAVSLLAGDWDSVLKDVMKIIK